jgi:hypothetical protein
MKLRSQVICSALLVVMLAILLGGCQKAGGNKPVNVRDQMMNNSHPPAPTQTTPSTTP